MIRLLTRRDFFKGVGAGAAGAAAASFLSACGSSDESGQTAAVVVDEENRVTDLIQASTFELSSFIPSHQNSPTIPTNFVDPLLACDAHNNIIPCLAESWSSNEGEDEWTFQIRQGVTWVDVDGNYKGDVTAEDWITGLEWVLNFWKNDSYGTAIPIAVITGAEDYYNYTQSLSEDEADALDQDVFLDMVGIEMLDEYTVVYHCINSVPYFESLATALWAFPLAQGQVDELGVKGYKSVTPDALWYCGPYVMNEYIDGNSKTIVPNPAYWDDTVVRFDSATWLITESQETAWELFELGTINYPLSFTVSQLDQVANDETNAWHDYICLAPSTSVMRGLYFNYAKKKINDNTLDTDWNKAAANENFRQCFYYGLNLYDFASTWDGLDPESCVRGTMSAPGISSLSDGTDYASLVMDRTGYNPSEYWSREDPDKLAEYKAAAMEELAAEGVSFPIHMDIWCGTTQKSENQYLILKETFEDALGTDLIEVEIHTYITDKTTEVYNPSYMSIEEQGYGALYGDPTTYLTQLCSDMSGNGEYADLYGHISECENQNIIDLLAEYTQMVREADAVTGDHDARLRALADAEAFALEHALVCPTVTNATRGVTCVNEYTLPSYINDTQRWRWVNMETKADFYTTEEYEAIRTAYYA